MNWTLEVVVVPVSDVDRAKDFYAGKLGFAVDHDTHIADGVRVVQVTPPVRPYHEGDDLNNNGFVYLSDPDGNAWAMQQISSRP